MSVEKTYYDVNGEVITDKNEKDVIAKSYVTEIKDGDKVFLQKKFYVKKYNQGISTGRLYNPIDIWNDISYNKKLWADVLVYQSVGENSFKLYLKFLDTKNPAYLRAAERERVN